MSIGAKPWESSGGAASVPDASETTKGKIRIATSAEATTGTDDLTAMTPLTVKERIDAAISGGVEYKGTFNATTGTPSLANAEKGDLYVIDTAGTIYGQTWAVGDHLLINADMGGSITNSKIDKVDNTDAVTSVNTQTGAVVLSANDLAADYTPTSYIPSNTNIDGHLEGIDDEFLLTAPLASPALTGTPTAPTATSGTNTTQIATTAFVTTAVAGAGGISSVSEDTDPTLGGDLKVGGFAITSTSNGDVTLDPNGTGDVVLGADLMPDADATHFIGDENTRFISAYTDINGAIRFKAKNDQGASISKGQAVYIKGVSGTVPTVGLARANSASTMPAFGLALTDANDQAEVQVVSFGNLTDYNTTTYSLSAGDTVFVSAATAGALTSSAPAGESNLIQNIGRVVRADASAGIVKVGGAGRSNATPNLDQDKIFVGNASNQAVSTALSAINLSSFNDDLTSVYQPLDAGLTSISGLTTSADKFIYTTASDTYAVASISAAGRSFVSANDAGAQRSALGLGTAATSNTGDFLASTAAVGDLSDVSITSVSNGQVLSYNSTSGDWENSTPASGGATDLDGLSDVTITSVSGGDLLQNNGSGQFVNVAKSSIDVSTFNDDGTYQASDAGLTSIAGLTTSANKMIYTTGSDTYAVTDLTAAGRALLDDADAAAQRTTLGLGTAATSASGDFQPIDAGLTSISGLTTAADKMIYTTGSDTYAVADLTSAGRALLDDADAAAQRTTLGLGTAATSNTGDFLANLSEDSSPQLGNALDVNGYAITSASNGLVEITPNGTGAVKLGGNTNPAELRFFDEGGNNYIALKAPADASISADETFTLPATDGTNGQVLQTNGSGVLSFVDQSGGGGGGNATLNQETLSADKTISTPSASRTIFVFTSSADRTINLPAASGLSSGQLVDIKSMSNVTFTITPNGTDNLDGVSGGTLALNVQYSSVTLVCDGTDDWFIV